jgi:hypothetical protein
LEAGSVSVFRQRKGGYLLGSSDKISLLKKIVVFISDNKNNPNNRTRAMYFTRICNTQESGKVFAIP